MQDQVQERPQSAKAQGQVLLQVSGLKVASGGIQAVNGVDFHKSVKKASSFIKKCIMKSIELDIPLTDGVCFEELLYSLK